MNIKPRNFSLFGGEYRHRYELHYVLPFLSPFHPVDDDETRDDVREPIFLRSEKPPDMTRQLFRWPFQILSREQTRTEQGTEHKKKPNCSIIDSTNDRDKIAGRDLRQQLTTKTACRALWDHMEEYLPQTKQDMYETQKKTYWHFGEEFEAVDTDQ